VAVVVVEALVVVVVVVVSVVLTRFVKTCVTVTENSSRVIQGISERATMVFQMLLFVASVTKNVYT
jgi:hypothetical protein